MSICGQYHYSASSEHVKDVEDRKDILRDQKRCYLCLQGGHCAHECENGTLCRWCNGKHHQCICTKATKTLRKNNPEEAIKPEAKDDKEKQRTSQQLLRPTAHQRCFFKLPRHMLILNTATELFLFECLDSGSQRSYATNHLKKRLGLQPVKKETLNLNTFGQDI